MMSQVLIKMLDPIKARIADSFVKRNKTGRGSGEARLYVGGHGIRDWDAFFGDYSLKCFFDKRGLSDYMEAVEFEYKNPSQAYLRNISGDWEVYVDALSQLDDFIYFRIFRNNDNHNQNTVSRFYIKSDDSIWDLFRCIAIPNLSSVLIQKVVLNGELQLWFRLYLNDVGYEPDREIAHEIIETIESSEALHATEKQQLIKARLGQGIFRERILTKYRRCVITGLDDTRLLVASHIKPWIVCDNSERISRENGLALSPTFDKLFDRGFISFRDTGAIMLSNHFSDENFRRLGLVSGDRYDLRFCADMKPFLAYHRDLVFIR